MKSKRRYKPGEKVCLVSDPSITGNVKEMNTGLIQVSRDDPARTGRAWTLCEQEEIRNV